MAEQDTLLRLEDQARSAASAFGHAAGDWRDPDDLPGDEAGRWLAAVRSAHAWLPTYDGRPAADAAARLRDEWCLGDDLLALREAPRLLAWEAAARHLCAVLDSDDGNLDLESLERSWADWAARRRPA